MWVKCGGWISYIEWDVVVFCCYGQLVGIDFVGCVFIDYYLVCFYDYGGYFLVVYQGGYYIVIDQSGWYFFVYMFISSQVCVLVVGVSFCVVYMQ